MAMLTCPMLGMQLEHPIPISPRAERGLCCRSRLVHTDGFVFSHLHALTNTVMSFHMGAQVWQRKGLQQTWASAELLCSCTLQLLLGLASIPVRTWGCR